MVANKKTLLNPESTRPLEGRMRRARADYFLDRIPLDARILEIGAGSQWVGQYLRSRGHQNYVGLDLVPPADIVGDIRDWQALGLERESFDYIVAFEVVEHVDCLSECRELLKPGGKVLLTTPAPFADWIMYLLECIGLNQKRTSPHSNLTFLPRVEIFAQKQVWFKLGISQWATLTK